MSDSQQRAAEVIAIRLVRHADSKQIAKALADRGLLVDDDTARADIPEYTPGVKSRTIDEARIDMVHQLHEAVFGSTWARPEAPVDVWRMLLDKVRATTLVDDDTARLRSELADLRDRLGHSLPWLLDRNYRVTSATLYPKLGTIQATLKPDEVKP